MQRHYTASWLALVLGAGCNEPDSAGTPQELAVANETLATSLPPGFQEELLVTGFTELTALRFSPDGRLFVAEKQGRIWAYDSALDPGAASLVLDLRTETYNFWDRGLLGLAVDRAFPEKPYLYVTYTLDAHPVPVPGASSIVVCGASSWIWERCMASNSPY